MKVIRFSVCRIFPAAVLPDKKFRAIKLTFSLMLYILGIGIIAVAAPADLDTTFGIGGKVLTTVPANGVINGNAMVLQADGKIVVAGAGYLAGGTNSDIVLVRYNSNGTPDMTFGNAGRVFTDIAGRSDSANSIAVQADGKIVVAGSTDVAQGDHDFIVVRYNSDGSLDTTFDGDGKVVTTFGLTSETFGAMALGADGKIVIAGSSLNTASFQGNFLFAKYNANGSLDASFSNGGKLIDELSQCFYEKPGALLIQPDGKIVFAGQCIGGNVFYNIVGRYQINGSRDDTFSCTGSADGMCPMLVSSQTQPSLNGIALEANGRIVAVGKRLDKFHAVRLNTDGILINYFYGLPSIDGYLSSVAIQPNGKIVAVGSGINFTTLRFNPDDSIDTNFGIGGVVSTSILEGGFDSPKTVVIQPDGKILVAGSSNNNSFTLVRYLGDSVPLARKSFDYDGDGRADVSVFRPANSTWYLERSTAGFTALPFGISTDRLVPADYDGDGKTDVAVYRQGNWYLQRSRDGFVSVAFGEANDIPTVADFDGDGKADISVFRPLNGNWYRLNSSNGQFVAIPFGQNGDKPQIGDFDGDGKSDLAVFRVGSGTWYLLNSTAGFSAVQFGESSDIPTAADFDGDSKTDVSVFRPSSGFWYRINSSNGAVSTVQWGVNGDVPSAADFDGDGKADVTVFRPSNGAWYQNRSTGGFLSLPFGANGDIPTPAAFGQ